MKLKTGQVNVGVQLQQARHFGDVATLGGGIDFRFTVLIASVDVGGVSAGARGITKKSETKSPQKTDEIRQGLTRIPTNEQINTENST